MYNIVTNTSGTRSVTVTDNHLATIAKYHLLDNLADSNGIVDEGVLDKLKLNVRSLLADGSDIDLLNLCFDVIYHSNMKAPGLTNLISLYRQWAAEQAKAATGAPEEEDTAEEA